MSAAEKILLYILEQNSYISYMQLSRKNNFYCKSKVEIVYIQVKSTTYSLYFYKILFLQYNSQR